MFSKQRIRACAQGMVIGAGLALGAATGWAQSAEPGHGWSAAWQAPQGDAFLSLSARQATLRQVLTPHAAGTQLRIRLSNQFGTQPVQVGAVSIGLSAGEAQVAPSGPVAVRFAGRSDLVLAPGESRYSDPVTLPLSSMQRVAVSLYIPDSAISISRHFNGNEWVWSASGNRSAQAGGQGFTRNANLLQASHVLVDRLEVVAPTQPRRVVAMFGDSITDGFMGSASGIPLLPGSEPIGQDQRFPDFLQRRADAMGVPATFVSAAISGNRLLAGPVLPMFGPAGRSRLVRDVLSLPGVTDAVVLIGINDLGFSLRPSVTAQALTEGLRDAVVQLQQAGVRVTLGTLLPSRGATLGLAHGSAAVDAARQVVNHWIRTSAAANAVIDFDPCMQDPARPSRLNPAYDSGDGLHPNAAGYKAMAECASLSAFQAPSAGR